MTDMSNSPIGKPLQLGAWGVAALGALFFLYGLFTDDIVGGDFLPKFFGMLQLDRDSYLADAPRWRPTLPDRNGSVTGRFEITDLLTLAGVVDRTRPATAADAG